MIKKMQLIIPLIVLSALDAVLPLLPALGMVLIYLVLAKTPSFLEIVRQVYNVR